VADIINQSAENMNNLSEEVGKETQNKDKKLELMKNLLKMNKDSDKLLRNFTALGKEYLEGQKYSDRFSRSCVALMKDYIKEMGGYDKKVFLAFVGGGSLFGALFDTTIKNYPYLRQSN